MGKAKDAGRIAWGAGSNCDPSFGERQEGDYEKASQHFCMALELRPGFLQEPHPRVSNAQN